MAFITIGAGQRANASVVPAGAYISVQSEGTITDTSLVGGDEYVFSGGVSNGTTISSGYIAVHGGGLATDVVANPTAPSTNIILFLEAGGTVNGVSGPLFISAASGSTINNVSLTAGSFLDDQNIPYSANRITAFDPATDLLSITENGATYTVQLAGDYSGMLFTTADDLGGITFPAVHGTSIIVHTAANGAGIADVKSVTVNGSNNMVGLANASVTVNGGTGNVISLTGTGSITTSYGTSSTIVLGSGSATVTDNGQDTVFGGSGPATITGGAASEIVVGEGGPLTVNGGLGGGTYWGGGNSAIYAGSRGLAVMIGSNGDKLYSNGSAGDLFGVTGGSVLMDGSASAGSDVFFGMAGTGTLSFICGTGNDILALGQETNLVTLGAGHDVVFADTGTTGVSTITAGTGSADIVLGGASVNLKVGAGAHDRLIALFDYAPGADKISLSGYGADEVSQAIAGQYMLEGSAMLTLSDHTTLALIGVSRADASLFA